MRFKVEKLYRLPNAGTLKAFCDVVIDDVIVIKGVRILYGKKGFFVSMPQEQGKDNRWYDQVVCKTAATYEQLSTVVLDAYNGKEQAAVNTPGDWNSRLETHR